MLAEVASALANGTPHATPTTPTKPPAHYVMPTAILVHFGPSASTTKTIAVPGVVSCEIDAADIPQRMSSCRLCYIADTFLVSVPETGEVTVKRTDNVYANGWGMDLHFWCYGSGTSGGKEGLG